VSRRRPLNHDPSMKLFFARKQSLSLYIAHSVLRLSEVALVVILDIAVNAVVFALIPSP